MDINVKGINDFVLHHDSACKVCGWTVFPPCSRSACLTGALLLLMTLTWHHHSATSSLRVTLYNMTKSYRFCLPSHKISHEGPTRFSGILVKLVQMYAQDQRELVSQCRHTEIRESWYLNVGIQRSKRVGISM